MNTPIKFVMIGGFLGAGKTTLISQLARRFQAQGKHVCVVTNDQAAGLVDTEMLKRQGLEVNEVAGSCFCCNFNGLTDAIDEFETRQRPDVILAEPVGSCTDLIATIALPMMEKLGAKLDHSPYAVVLKPGHGLRILSGSGRGGFSPKAEYIFRKQLEESELILLNRIDELSPQQVAELQALLAEQYPGREIICLSAKTGKNIEQLFTALQSTAAARQTTMDVDYDVYAEGEAELGWLNATAVLHSDRELPLDAIAVELVEDLRQRFLALHAEPGHLKILCSSAGDVSVANLVSSESPTMLSMASEATSRELSLIINARIRLAPEPLQEVVCDAVQSLAGKYAARAELQQLESFRPGRPTPTFRAAR
ncbi:MAG: cobalamin biosynthesis protein P47K [Planctomycetales bacterium]|nr:cobalamin biosynthesis protein P47K [Planctomycetales bacterium]